MPCALWRSAVLLRRLRVEVDGGTGQRAGRRARKIVVLLCLPTWGCGGVFCSVYLFWRGSTVSAVESLRLGPPTGTLSAEVCPPHLCVHSGMDEGLSAVVAIGEAHPINLSE